MDFSRSFSHGWLLAEARKRALSRRFVYYGMGGLFIDGYGWIGGMGGMWGGLFIHGYRNENHI